MRWGRFPDLALRLADAGEGAHVDLGVGGPEALLALPLGPATAEDGTQVTTQEAQRHGDEGRALEREKDVYRDDRGRRRLGVGAGNTFGLMTMSTTAEIRPTSMPVTAPAVLTLFQKIVSRMTGTFALAATAKARAESSKIPGLIEA